MKSGLKRGAYAHVRQREEPATGFHGLSSRRKNKDEMAMSYFLNVIALRFRGIVRSPISALGRGVMLVLLCCLLGCSGSLDRKIDFAHEIEEEFRKTCRTMSFEGDDSSYSVENRNLHVLRSVQGVIKAKSGYLWDEGEVVFKVRSLRGTATYTTQNKRNGKFSISSLPDGFYCYIAAAVGWQTEEGRILIDQGAPLSATLDISLIID